MADSKGISDDGRRLCSVLKGGGSLPGGLPPALQTGRLEALAPGNP
jgi:hypothetical protein